MTANRVRSLVFALCAAALLAVPATAKKGKDTSAIRTPDTGTINAPQSEYRPLPRRDTLFINATILDGAGNRFTGDILVRDGFITAVGPNLPREADITIIDASGRWITPGIVDIHTHYGTFLLPLSAGEYEVSDITENSDPNVAETWIEHAVHPTDPAFSRALAGGVTTVQILPGSGALFGGRSVVVRPVPAVTLAQMRFPDAPQGLKMACGSNPANSFGGRGRFPNSRQGEIAGVRRAFLDARAYQMEYQDDLQEYLSGKDGDPPRLDLQKETLVKAMQGELPVHLHCYRAEDIATWINVLDEFGVKIAAVHHATEAYKIAPLLAERGVCAAVWPDWWGFKREAEDAIPENAAFVEAAKGCAIMHSDIPLLGSLLNIEAAKAAAAGRRAGLDIPPETAIRWITSNPAQTLGLGERTGMIKKDMLADLVIWSGNPFSIYTKADQVFIDGALAFDRSNPAYQPQSDFELGRPQKGQLP